MSKKIMVVDDEDHIREVAQLALEAVGGFMVVSVGSADAAVDAARRENPDLILLDVMMPDVDGPTLFRRIRAEVSGTVPIVFLTAKAQASERLELERLEPTGVIAKPFDPMTLAAQISALAGWSGG